MSVYQSFGTEIIVTVCFTAVSVLLFSFVLASRSRCRHRRLSEIPNTVTFELTRYLDKTRTHRFSRILAGSLEACSVKVSAPLTERPVPCFVVSSGKPIDVQQEALLAHAKLRAVLAKIPETSGRVHIMTFRQILSFLQHNVPLVDPVDIAYLISFHEQVRFHSSFKYISSEEEWLKYSRGIDQLLEKCRSSMLFTQLLVRV